MCLNTPLILYINVGGNMKRTSIKMKYKELKEIEIDNLEFDKNNPRLPKKLYGASETEVIHWMLLDASLLDLIGSIASNGFFPGEPLLVIEKNGKYTVIEGNRRLASCKILNNPSLASVKIKSVNNVLETTDSRNIPKQVPAFVFEAREDILAYLGYRHVTGVKSWGALPKAKYLFELFQLIKDEISLKDKCKLLAKQIGSRGDYVLRLLTSYELYLEMEKNEFFGIKNLSEENIEFSNLVDSATRFGNISKFLNIDFDNEIPLENLDMERYSELAEWLFKRDEENKTKLGENRNIRLLNQVVANDKAITAFRADTNIKEAYLLTSVPDEIFTKSITSSLRNLINADDVKENLNSKIPEDAFKDLDELESLVKQIKDFIS